jgi:uncharacterized protein (TIGR03792 family)
MVIEWLAFRIDPADQPAWLKADAAIWTPALAAQPGYLGKEAWVDQADPAALSLIIRWDSLAAWKAVPRDVLDATEAAFRARLGRSWPVLSCTALDVRAPGDAASKV